jgi:DnaK suppressor protein
LNRIAISPSEYAIVERIEDGTFGICEMCERKISEKRLMARPVTTLCIECKTEQEQREKMRGE